MTSELWMKLGTTCGLAMILSLFCAFIFHHTDAEPPAYIVAIIAGVGVVLCILGTIWAA